MNAHELASLLNGREYRKEITKEEEAIAKENGLVVVFGYSDDGVELRGAIREEVGAYNECVFSLDSKGRILEDIGDVTIESSYSYTKDVIVELYESYLKHSSGKIEVNQDNGWKINTEIPHAKFEVKEDGEFYGDGIVFVLNEANPIRIFRDPKSMIVKLPDNSKI